MDITIRKASPEDGAALAAIYAPYVEKTAITFEYEAPSADEFTRRIEAISRDYPYLVCCADGVPVGYAYGSRQLERAAYQWNGEISVYLAEGCPLSGAGRALCRAVLSIMALQHVRNVYSIVTVGNGKSEHLHSLLGFRKLCVLPHTGYKKGRWYDTEWYEKELGNGSVPPFPFRSVREVADEEIQPVLENCAKEIGVRR